MLNHILAHLEEAGSYVLATPEDANYFRATARKRKIGNGNGNGQSGVHPQDRSDLQGPRTAPAAPAPVPTPVPVPPSRAPLHPPVTVTVPLPVPDLPKPAWDLSSIRNLLSIVAPELAIINEIPSDATAKKIAERWKTKNQSAPISILLFQEPGEQRALLEQIARALDVYFGPAKIVNAEKIEKEKQWEAFLSVADLKMVIICDYTLWQLNGLLQFYKETPAQGIRTLGNVPLFLLPDLSLYLKDPLLKRSLWKALCQKFS